jgi:hypothetical protein
MTPTERSRTKTEAALAEAELAHADDPERAEVLRRTRLFKSSWIELAETLTNVRRGARWKDWGYASFDEYAKRELYLRQETVDKLTGSFTFLQRRAPEVLARDGVRALIPSYQAVDFLRRAEEQDDAPRETVAELRARVLDEAAPLATVARRYKDQIFPIDERERRSRDVAAIKNVATRLRELHDSTHAVPRRLATDVAEALDRLLYAVRSDAA